MSPKPPNFFLQAHVPLELMVKWLQHLRDFDVANGGVVHFNMTLNTPNLSVQEVTDMLDHVEPGFAQRETFTKQ